MDQHKHTGMDGSFKLEARDSLENAPQIAITKPTGGSVIDVEARTAINDIIDKLKTLGLTY